MTSATARARAVPSATQLGGQPDYPVAVKFLSPLKVIADLIAGRFSRELMEMVEIGAECLPAARRGELDCILCRKPFVGLPVRIGWLETPGGSRRALFGACVDCDGPDIDERLCERLGATEMTVN
jgi:hypothetical protein